MFVESYVLFIIIKLGISLCSRLRLTLEMSARLRNLNPYELHKYLVNVYCLTAKGSTAMLSRDASKDRTDIDVIRDNHKFLWEEDDVADTWEKQLAKKYYDKLFKEYCICDLSMYKKNKVSYGRFSSVASARFRPLGICAEGNRLLNSNGCTQRR